MKNIILIDTTLRKKQQSLVENPLTILDQIYHNTLDETAETCLQEIKKKHRSERFSYKIYTSLRQLRTSILQSLEHFFHCKIEKCHSANNTQTARSQSHKAHLIT